MKTTWTADQVRALGVRTDVETAGSIFGLSRTQAYIAVNKGTFPVPVIRMGRRYLVPTAPILRLLGIDRDDTGTGNGEQEHADRMAGSLPSARPAEPTPAPPVPNRFQSSQ
jgi:hypothetical protein